MVHDVGMLLMMISMAGVLPMRECLGEPSRAATQPDGISMVVRIARSADGLTFRDSGVLPVVNAGSPSVAELPNKSLLAIVYRYPHPLSAIREMVVLHSEDEGKTWSEPRVARVLDRQGESVFFNARVLARGPDGLARLYMVSPATTPSSRPASTMPASAPAGGWVIHSAATRDGVEFRVDGMTGLSAPPAKAIRLAAVEGDKGVDLYAWAFDATERDALAVHKGAPALLLTDETGKSFALLNVDENGPELALSDENSKTRVMLSVSKNGPGLALFDENGKRLAGLNVGKNGTGLILSDEKGETRAGLIMGKNGPGLGLFDENGKTRARLNVTNDRPELKLYDENSMSGVTLNADRDGPGLGLFDENGKPRAELLVREGEPSLVLNNEKGEKRAVLEVHGGATGLALSDENDKSGVILAAGRDGPKLGLLENGMPLAGLSVHKGEPMLVLYDEKGKMIWSTPQGA